MSDLISRKDLLKALDKFIPVDPLKDDYTKGITVGIGLASGCVEKFSQWNGGSSQGLVKDLISRQQALKAIEDEHHNTKVMSTMDNGKLFGLGAACNIIRNLPSAEPERLTDDDFETIRIHLNAQKEKLCNQQRWEEAEEYQRIIDRFMAFASAEPERKTAEWIYGENGGQDGWYCSKCGLFIPWDYEYYGLDNIDFIEDFKTCPFCDSKMVSYTGADMRGKEDE